MAETGSLPEEAGQAAARGNEAALLAWLESGGQVNATRGVRDVSGVSVLMTAAGHGHERLVELLLRHGAAINMQDSDGDTALMDAAYGHERVVELLLQRGAEINLQNRKGFTALIVAAGQGRERVVDLLLQRGADANLEDT